MHNYCIIIMLWIHLEDPPPAGAPQASFPSRVAASTPPSAPAGRLSGSRRPHLAASPGAPRPAAGARLARRPASAPAAAGAARELDATLRRPCRPSLPRTRRIALGPPGPQKRAAAVRPGRVPGRNRANSMAWKHSSPPVSALTCGQKVWRNAIFDLHRDRVWASTCRQRLDFGS